MYIESVINGDRNLPELEFFGVNVIKATLIFSHDEFPPIAYILCFFNLDKKDTIYRGFIDIAEDQTVDLSMAIDVLKG